MDTETFEQTLGLVDAESQEHIRKFHHHDDAKRCLVGRLLARAIVCHLGLCKWPEAKFSKTPEGRPFLLPVRTVFDFNVSHDSSFVACAFLHATQSPPSKSLRLLSRPERPLRVGVDVMRLELPEWCNGCTADLIDTVHDQLTDSESEYLFNEQAYEMGSDQVPIYRIYRIWTHKEAFTKAIGMGLGIDWKRVDVLLDDEDEGDEDEDEDEDESDGYEDNGYEENGRDSEDEEKAVPIKPKKDAASGCEDEDGSEADEYEGGEGSEAERCVDRRVDDGEEEEEEKGDDDTSEKPSLSVHRGRLDKRPDFVQVSLYEKHQPGWTFWEGRVFNQEHGDHLVVLATDAQIRGRSGAILQGGKLQGGVLKRQAYGPSAEFSDEMSYAPKLVEKTVEDLLAIHAASIAA